MAHSKLVNAADAAAEKALVTQFEQVRYLGISVVSIGAEGGTVYLGHTFRAQSAKYGDCLAVLGGDNARRWGTKVGRGELAWGEPDRSQHDPCPGVLIPWERVLSMMPVTTAWEPRKIQSKELQKIMGE